MYNKLVVELVIHLDLLSRIIIVERTSKRCALGLSLVCSCSGCRAHDDHPAGPRAQGPPLPSGICAQRFGTTRSSATCPLDMSIYENDGGAQSAPSAPGAPTMVDAMQTAGGKPALSIPKTKEEWMAARPKIALLVGGFFLVLLCLIGLWPSSETLGDGAPPPPPTGSRGTQSIDGKNYFIHGSPQQIRQNDQQSDVSLPLDYAVGFEFTPTGDVVDSWSNIIHFTATGNDCCNYGDR
eukprot:SAG31_NODE_974_length_10627_cov_11.246201_8_plen_238_part_00